MEGYRKEIRAKLLEYGGIKEIVKKKGVGAIIKRAHIDLWSRYMHVINEIRKIKARKLSVLDLGAGGQGISVFSSSLRRDCDFFLLDVRKDEFKGLGGVYRIVGDRRKLQLIDKARAM